MQNGERTAAPRCYRRTRSCRWAQLSSRPLRASRLCASTRERRQRPPARPARHCRA